MKSINQKVTNVISVGKTVKVFLLVFTIAFSSVLHASTTPKDLESTAITTEVAQLLKKPKFLLENDISVNVTITFNKDNEIVVLSVDSENEQIKDFIKNRLNYSKLAYDIYNKKQTFIVPVRLDVE